MQLVDISQTQQVYNMTPQFEIPCVILCGGKSSRMKEDKSLLPFSSSKTLTQYQYEKLKPHFKELYLSSKLDKFDFDANIIFDENEEFSPIVALQTILKKLSSHKKVFIITVDTPLVKIESIKQLIEASNDVNICVAKTEKTHNLCGVFSTNMLIDINKMLEKNIHKVGFLLKNTKTSYINFSDNDEFINLNNPDDYKEACSIISNANI